MLKLYTLGDPRVTQVYVRGDLIVDESNRDRIMTRSRTKDSECLVGRDVVVSVVKQKTEGVSRGKRRLGWANDNAAPHRYTQIPFPLKAFKLLLKDLQTMGQGSKGKEAVDKMGIGSDDGVSTRERVTIGCDKHREWEDVRLTMQDDDWDDDDDDLGDDVGEFDYLSCELFA